MTPAALAGFLDWLTTETAPEMQLSTLRAFLFVATRGGCTQKEVEEGLGLSNAAASRNISYWTERRFDREPGKGFIKREEEDYDRRSKRLTLTKKGEAFYKQIKDHL